MTPTAPCGPNPPARVTGSTSCGAGQQVTQDHAGIVRADGVHLTGARGRAEGDLSAPGRQVIDESDGIQREISWPTGMYKILGDLQILPFPDQVVIILAGD